MEKIDSQLLLVLGYSSAHVRDAKVLLGKLRQSLPNVHLQLMRADRIAGREHLSFATSNAVRAFRQEYRRSRSLEVEILLYASCQRQISKAIQILGVTPLTKDVAVVALSESARALSRLPTTIEKMMGGKQDSNVLEIGSERKLSHLKNIYGIGDLEIEAAKLPGEAYGEVVKKLVIERSALLALEG